MKYLLLSILILSFVALTLGQPSFSWAHGIGGNSYDIAECIQTDDSSNTYVAGIFSSDSVDFNPGSGTTLKYRQGSIGNYDIFIQKFNPSGVMLWAKTLEGDYDDRVRDLIIDANGNILICGYFNDVIDFDPGPNTVTKNAATGADGFLLKLNSNGDFMWVKVLESYSKTVTPNTIKELNNGDILLAGSYRDSVDLNPGAPVQKHTSNTNRHDAFIVKLTSSGDYIWSKSFGNDRDEVIRGLAFDLNNNIFATGYFESDSVNFNINNPSFLYNQGNSDVFILKLDSLGNYIWAKQIGATGSDEAESIIIDKSGSILLGGTFSNGPVDFDPDSTNSQFLSGNQHFNTPFLAKYDQQCNFIWAKSLNGTGHSRLYDFTQDGVGNLIIGGAFSSNIDCDPNSTVFSLTSNGGDDGFICSLDSNGSFNWAFQIGSSGNFPTNQDYVGGVSINNSFEISYSGYFHGTIDANQDVNQTHNLISSTVGDYFVVKLSNLVSINEHTWSKKEFITYPNPATNKLFLNLEDSEVDDKLQCYSLSGKLVSEYIVNNKKIELDISNFRPGIYMFKYGSLNKKVVISK